MGFPPALDAALHAALTATAPTTAAEALVGLAPPPASSAAAPAAPGGGDAAAAAPADAPRRWVTTARTPLTAGTSFFVVPHLLTFDGGEALMETLDGGSPELLGAVASAVGLRPPAEAQRLERATPSPPAVAAAAASAAAAAVTRHARPPVTDVRSLLVRLGGPPLSGLDGVRVVDLRGDGLDDDGVAALRLPLLTPGVEILDVRGNRLPAPALTALVAELPRLRVLGCEPLDAATAAAVGAAARGLEVINGVRVVRVSAAEAAATTAATAAAAEGDAAAGRAAAAAADATPEAATAAAADAVAAAAAPPPSAEALLAAVGPFTHAYTVARPDNPADTRAVWYVPAGLGAGLRHGAGDAVNVRVGRVFWGGGAVDVVWATANVPAGGALVRDYAEGQTGAARQEVLEHFGVQD